MITAKHHWLADALIYRYLIGLCRKRFHSVKVKGLDHLDLLDPMTPVIAIANHTNWWDGFMAYFLSKKMKDHQIHLMMEHKQMQHYSIFRHIGAFSVELDSKIKSAKSLHYAVRVLQKPSSLMWIFPQGSMVSPHAPLKFKPGLDFLIKKTPQVQLMTIAFRYEFLREDRPQALVLIDQPQLITPSSTASPEDQLHQCCEKLFQDLKAHTLDDYQSLLAPQLSINKKWEKFLFTIRGESSIFKQNN
ncbi:MAG: lysophospholipid acyltransferase family protein [Verrucomicrobiota bacterium]